MKLPVLFAWLIAMLLGGCSGLPGAGPSEGQVVEQGKPDGDILFDVVKVDSSVVSTLLAQPEESFKARFNNTGEPPDIKIGIGDTISVSIWESAAGGLFNEAPAAPPSSPTTEPLAPESQPRTGPRRSEGKPPRGSLPIELNAGTGGRQFAIIPDQQVGADGAISVPYADRIPAAGRTPAEVQQTIEERLAQKALQPQALVIVKKSSVNTVTVTGETRPAVSSALAGEGTAAKETAEIELITETAAVPISAGGDTEAPSAAGLGFGARVPLSPGGDRLLQVIAAAGGTNIPVYETFVRLSRNGVTATIPMTRLVSDPAEDIYALPGDVLTLVRVPQTFSVFGATRRNAEINFGAEKISLSEALAKSQGLRDDLANPQGVFLFRYEPDSIVHALDQPIATRAENGRSPVAYRFDFRDGASYFLANQFPVRDKDIIFVADAGGAQVQKLFKALAYITGPIISAIIVCRQTTC